LRVRPVFAVSAFADEIDPSVDVQLERLADLGIRAIDVRSAWGRNVLQLTEPELRDICRRCHQAGIRVQSVGSPVNKAPLTEENRRAEVEKLKTAIRAAGLLETERVRVFTPETGAGDDDSAHWALVQSWMEEMVSLSQDAGTTLLHENDARFFGAFPNNAKTLFARFGGASFRAAFDFANAVLIGQRPLDDWFPWLLPHLDTLHIKDALRMEGKVVPAGEGDGQLRETLSWLIGQSWSGTLTLEPHLAAAGEVGGFSGPQLFDVAARALREVLEDVGGSW
jgi:3-dehydroshikimate dehydratase